MTGFFSRVLSSAALALTLAATLAFADPAVPISLGIEGRAFTINGSPTFLVFISYFDALRREAAGGVDSDFDYLNGKVHGVRILPNWWEDPCALRSGTDTLIDVEGRIRANGWRDLQAVLDRAASHRLVVDVSLTRETVTDNGSPPRVLTFDAYAEALVKLVGSAEFMKGKYPHVLIDVQNEWPRFADAEEVEDLLGRLRSSDPARILVASSSGGSYEPVGATVRNMAAAYHDPRSEDWFTAAAARQVVKGVRSRLGDAVQPVYLQEPTPGSADCPAADFDDDASHFVEAMTHANAAGAAAWTFHTRLGFALRERTLVQKLDQPEHASQKTVIDRLLRPPP